MVLFNQRLPQARWRESTRGKGGITMKKRAITILLALVMCLSLATPAMAEGNAPNDSDRIIVEVENFDDIADFCKSSRFDFTQKYTFIIKNVPQTRALCPNCGNGAMTGSNHRVENVAVYLQACPAAGGMTSDIVSVMSYYYRENCRRCGYEIVHNEYYFSIECEYAMPGTRPYEAWDGQRWQDGYDIHEDKSVWFRVPAMYH